MLLTQAVALIREGFDLYYVGLFLLDEAGQSAVLRAGTGEAGSKMVSEKHHLHLDEKSMIGWCITHGQTRVAQQANHDEVRLPNPLLPDTRSEMAIPLISRGRAIGALTFQDVDENAFRDEDITMVSNMVDQLAIAIDNANLFEAAEKEIRERKKVELALQQERDFAVQVMNALGQGVTVTNREGVFEYVNPAYATMVGLSQEEIVGKSPENFTHPEDKIILQGALQKRRFGQVTSYQVRLVKPGGEIAHALITGSPRYQNSEILGSIAVITDLSEHIRIQAEREALIKELEAKNAELERFTYTVSHDLKSPLITIRGFLGYLEGDAKTGNIERFQSDLRRIGDAASKRSEERRVGKEC
jgi:PAS domain S-box-containing protein